MDTGGSFYRVIRTRQLYIFVHTCTCWPVLFVFLFFSFFHSDYHHQRQSPFECSPAKAYIRLIANVRLSSRLKRDLSACLLEPAFPRRSRKYVHSHLPKNGLRVRSLPSTDRFSSSGPFSSPSMICTRNAMEPGFKPHHRRSPEPESRPVQNTLSSASSNQRPHPYEGKRNVGPTATHKRHIH